MAIANIAIPILLTMKNILALVAITLIVACKEDNQETFYPDNAITADVESSRNSFIINGIKNSAQAATFKYSAKYAGDKVGLSLATDTNTFAPADTTWFSVTYKKNNEVMFKDTGYAFGINKFTSQTEVK